MILAIFGLLAIYDASVVEGYKDFSDKFHFVKQQAVWLVIGIVVSLFAAGFPLATLKKYSHVFLLGCLFLMVLVLIPGIGSKFLGARRWIIFGPIVIQPSELIKIALILYLARWLEVSRSLKQFLALLGLCLGLVMLQPDLGTGVVIVGTCFILYYLSGANLKDISIFMGLLVITMSVLVFASPYRMNRLKTFMDPTSDPLGASYHINQVRCGCWPVTTKVCLSSGSHNRLHFCHHRGGVWLYRRSRSHPWFSWIVPGKSEHRRKNDRQI